MPVIINGTTGVTFPNGVTMSDGTSAPVTVAQGGTGANTASAARTSLGVAIGTDVLAPNGSGANLTSLNASSVSSGTLALANGGTGANTATAAFNALNPMTTTGDIIYEASPTVAARLGIGSTGQVLTVSGGIPAWTTISTTPTTEQVLNATAGASAGGVGTYIMASQAPNVIAARSYNSTYAGSSIRACGNASNGNIEGPTSLSGTWRLLGYVGGSGGGDGASTYYAFTLYLRIS
jgi:hypothetical protein